jgi:error-prone DNA polymerase
MSTRSLNSPHASPDLHGIINDVLERRRSQGYVELCARTNFSFLAGGSTPEKMIARAKALGYGAVGIADVHGLYGIVRAQEEAKKAGVALVVGAEVWTLDGGLERRITLHVQNHAGYMNLCRVLTLAHSRRPRDDRSQARGRLEELCAHSEGLFATFHAPYDDEAVRELKAAFGRRLSLSVRVHKDGEDRARIAMAQRFERTHAVAILATNDVRFATPEEKPVLDVLTCIKEGTTLQKAGRLLLPNSEACLRSPEDMGKLFSMNDAWVARSRVIADACTFSLSELRYKFPCEISDQIRQASEKEPRGKTAADRALRYLVRQGEKERYPTGVPEGVRTQIEKELGVIERLDVASYFLSVHEIVEIARARDILCQGRGSAANSAVCYCLGITAVDPSRSSLLFERFLSEERAEPPDIDVDFEHERREEVIQEIYRRYGRDRAAMASEVISYRGKSSLREVAKVFGYTDDEATTLSGIVTWHDSIHAVDEKRLADAGFDLRSETHGSRLPLVMRMASAIQGFPRHLSIHVGGFVLSAEPLDRIAPVEPATMDGRTIIPWDKDDLDTLGFFKVDVLGLGMLTAIRKALAFAKDDPRIFARDAVGQLARVPAEDPRVYDALCRADTVGVFQIESRAQMAMLPRLRPRSFYDLVIEVAIVRPGPIQGGMVHPYLRRRNGEEEADPPHKILEPILARTLGVPLFQEQVMQIAITGAGYSGGEADQLRRDMAAWRKNGNLARHRERLMSGFRERGIAEAFGEQLYAQIQGFGEYGFPESHAASFALLVYASSWLKVHKPAAFAAALVNSQPMGFYSPSTLLQDAQRHGVVVHPVCVTHSDWDLTLVGADGEVAAHERNEIRLGLRMVKNLPEDAGRRIEAARKQATFASVEDLRARAELDKRALTALAESGALDALTHGRREALWEVVAPRETGLFRGLTIDEERPRLAPLSSTEQLAFDYETTGVSVADHPMRHVRPSLEKRLGRASRLLRTSANVADVKHKGAVVVAGLVICRQRPMTASGVVFMTLEDEWGFLNLVLWERVFSSYRHVATTSGLLLVRGKVEKAAGVLHVICDSLEPLGLAHAPEEPQLLDASDERAALPADASGHLELPSMSRDFH